MRHRLIVCLCLAGVPLCVAGGPTIPSADNPPPAAARLDAAVLPAAEDTATLLHVSSPGRFTLATHSATGASLQLVDMLAGPGAPSGLAGAQDGRLDELLDTGTYKLRVSAAHGATGTVGLGVTPFSDAAPPASLPAPGVLLAADLTDGQQRSFWLGVPADGKVRIEATGRSLADLRLWRDGRDLVDMAASAEITEAMPGRPMTTLTLQGAVEPGTYLVTAYGGPAATWSDGNTTQPFYLRQGVSDALEAGWAGGTIGPVGTEILSVPRRAAALRLDLPRAAPVSLTAVGGEAVSLTSRSREAGALLYLPPYAGPGSTEQRIVVLRRLAGQPYQIRVIEALSGEMVSVPGHYWVSVNTSGAGGDEVPPTLLLVRRGRPEADRIVGSTLPHVGPGLAWRATFNLRGPTRLLLQADQGGPLALTAAGAALDRDFDPRGYYDLPAGFYRLALRPKPGAQGAMDITFGPPGLAAAPTPPLPADPVISFGEQDIGRSQSLQLFAPEAADASFGLSARPAPVMLSDDPLTVTQLAGQPLSIPVVLPPGKSVDAHVMGVAGPLAVRAEATGTRVWRVAIPAPEAARTLVLGIARPVPTAADVPPPRARDRLPALTEGRPAYLDLAALDTPDGHASAFALRLARGGLYRIETVGRMKTQGSIGTSFIPELASATANGAGQNFLLQPWLRAGDYRVSVAAVDSTGHLGVQAVPAPLGAAPPLLPGGCVRATLAAGEGVSIPVTIGQPGTYHVSLLGQGGGFSARLDDSEGWPLVVPGAFDDRTLDLRAGQYSLLVTPGATQQRLVATLDRTLPAVPIVGHGPHILPIGDTLAATWREPALATSPRTPDTYRFDLAGPATAHATLGKGMEGILSGPAGASVHFAGAWQGKLEAGAWTLSAQAQGRDDRLDYTVSVTTDELQPGRPRDVDLPSQTPFTLARPQVVTLATSGLAATRAVLRAADGSVLARAGARENDWNTALSLRLPAGSYRVDLAPGLPPSTLPVTADRAAREQPEGDDDEDQRPQTQPNQDAADNRENQPDGESGEAAAGSTSLRLELPAELPAVPAPVTEATLAGAGVHVLSLPPVPPGALLVATGHGAGTSIVALERQAGDGTWRTVAQARGAAPIAASMGDADVRPWRAVIWSLDGDAIPMVAAAQVVTAAPADRLAALPGLRAAVARVELNSPAVTSVGGGGGDVLAASWPGHGAEALQHGLAMPQGNIIWLVAPNAGRVTVAPVTGGALTLDVPAGAEATLPGARVQANHLTAWRADSGQGQPAWRAGSHLGAVAPLSAVIVTDTAPALSNAGPATEVLRAAVRAIDLRVLPLRPLDAVRSFRLLPGEALPVDSTAAGNLSVSLSAGLAAFLSGPDGERGVWAPVDPATTVLPGATQILVANLGSAPGYVGLHAVPATGPALLRAGMVVKQFHGAAGAFALTADVPDGGRLAVAGPAALMVRDARGAVLQGNVLSPAAGLAAITVSHAAGLIVLSLEGPGRPAWIAPSPTEAALPAHLALAGNAMAVRVPADGPVLLHATTTAPVLLGLPGEPPELFASGAEFHRAVPGTVELHIFSPQDGPLTGTLSLWTEPVRPAAEGLGETVAVPPGGSAAFGFALTRAARVGVGVRATPDTASVRLLDGGGHLVGEGVAQLRDLSAGHYVIEARVPPDAPPTLVRAALVGSVPRPNGPPQDVVDGYLELAGLKPVGGP
jgi:hypothetical protein